MAKYPENLTTPDLEARLPVDAFDEKARVLERAMTDVELAVARLSGVVDDILPMYKAISRYWREAEGLGVALAPKEDVERIDRVHSLISRSFRLIAVVVETNQDERI